MSPKFKKMKEYRRERELKESIDREHQRLEAHAMEHERVNHIVQVLEEFIGAVTKHAATQFLEDEVTLNKARENLTNELVHIIEVNRIASE
jgi:hypothetical protein